MRHLSLFIWSIMTITLCYYLNNPIGPLPAIGKVVSPSHGFWRLLEGEIPELPEEVIHENLKDEVTVVWDENLIPHIYAQNDEDLYFVQGYITSSMRLWQMDFTTRAAAGRLSEIVGEATLELDLNTRRKGLELGTQKIMAVTLKEPYAKMAYEQYAKGVNAYINNLAEKNWPLEYRLLDMEPEPWSVLRTFRVANYMANRVDTRNNDIEYTNFLNAFDYASWQQLFEGYYSDEDPIVENPGGWDFTPVIPEKIPTDTISAPSDFVETNKPDRANGSNNWAVSPKRSATGNALFASDPHLGLSLPNLYFLSHLRTPEINTMGIFFPGVPGPIGAMNDSVAYGGTVSMRDLVDWYRVKFADDTKTKILVDGKEVNIIPRIEEIKIKGKPSVFDTIYYSPFGIIANHSEISAKKNEAWAYRWTGQDDNQVPIAILEMAKSNNWEEFTKGVKKFDAPHLNWAYADTQGNIGMYVAGSYLLRQGNEGLFLRDGTKSENIWSSYIPSEHAIQEFNPDRGFVSSANQYPVDRTYPYVINAFNFPSDRNKRINQMLRADSIVTVEDMKNFQFDNYVMEASDNLKFFLSTLNYEDMDEAEKAIYKDLSSWNLLANPELKAPAYFMRWRHEIWRLAWDELQDESTAFAYPTYYKTFSLLRNKPKLTWWDIDTTEVKEDATRLISTAFKQMHKYFDGWSKTHKDIEFNWANEKGTTLTHLTQLDAFGQQNVYSGGGFGIVNATGSRAGPVLRMIVELDPNGTKGWGIIPGGQSGNPGSLWYNNLTEPWAKGDYIDLDLYYKENNPKRLFVSQFKPVKK